MTYTKGNIIVENINIGDIHYEYYGTICIKSEVISMPVCEEHKNGKYWSWKSKTENGSIIEYGVHSAYPHYGPNLYDYPAYLQG